ncbi:hypothetical protein ABZS52_18360 [Micromonospora profundi]|uniref:hypothetical protein n=1 Tax=Micromonospora profundi TaxID=1420889 RepID=UPI0033A0C7D5
MAQQSCGDDVIGYPVMTTGNWKRVPGEKVEKLVPALLLRTHPRGNHLTLNLDESAEWAGRWWLPDDPDERSPARSGTSRRTA